MRKALLALILASTSAWAQTPANFDAAAAFGARSSVEDIALSPSGKRIAFLAPGAGTSSTLFVVPTDKSAPPKRVTAASGNPERLAGCWWVSDERLLCTLYVAQRKAGFVGAASRLIAINADGTNVKLVSRRESIDADYSSTDGGSMVDLLPRQSGQVLVARAYVPQDTIGSLGKTSQDGLGVDRIDTATLQTKTIVPPMKRAFNYISDGMGNVRVAEIYTRDGDYQGKLYKSMFRGNDGGPWQPLADYDGMTREGFNPLAVDSTENVVYGYRKLDGRQTLYKISLDGSRQMTPVFGRPDVDVSGLVRLGRKQRVVGVGYVTDRRYIKYFDPAMDRLSTGLAKALPTTPQIAIVDASEDESKLLIRAEGDTDTGAYYLLDRATKSMTPLIGARPELGQTKLANVTAMTFTASDGTSIPGYLTLPPGSTGKGLPAIVMPHGGPEARDEWGFDWLAQFYANRGYAVLQPNFRGSSGYGDSWFKENGFKGWRTAIGDVVDAGRYLVKSGIADPGKLGIVGWSYGGYAALQSQVLDAKLFKAVVAIAPVTDLGMLKSEYDGRDFQYLARQFIGSGTEIVEAGSPARHADVFVAPVLLFHGDADSNVRFEESQAMEAKLRGAGKQVQFVTYPGLDHSLPDGAIRADMLRKSDAFLRTSMGIR